MRGSGEYPADWPAIAERIKTQSGWKCERCEHAHDPENGYTLTVHHLIPDKSLCEDWNLAALCQRCHLSIQARVNMFQKIFDFVDISDWFKPHFEGFEKWRVDGWNKLADVLEGKVERN